MPPSGYSRIANDDSESLAITIWKVFTYHVSKGYDNHWIRESFSQKPMQNRRFNTHETIFINIKLDGRRNDKD